MTPREDKGEREGIPHTHPILKVIRLKIFLLRPPLSPLSSLTDAHANFTGFHLKVTKTVLNAKNWKRFIIWPVSF